MRISNHSPIVPITQVDAIAAMSDLDLQSQAQRNDVRHHHQAACRFRESYTTSPTHVQRRGQRTPNTTALSRNAARLGSHGPAHSPPRDLTMVRRPENRNRDAATAKITLGTPRPHETPNRALNWLDARRPDQRIGPIAPNYSTYLQILMHELNQVARPCPSRHSHRRGIPRCAASHHITSISHCHATEHACAAARALAV